MVSGLRPYPVPAGESSSRRRHLPVRSLAAALAIAASAAAAAGAQGDVRGRVAIVERAGTRTTDLANAVVWLERADGAPMSGGAEGRGQIAMESRTFVPRVQVVRVGGSVEFPNHDPFRHNVFSKSGPGEFDLGLYGRGDSRAMTASRPGIYPIFCNIHSRMVAHVVAVATPYVTQAGSDGSFVMAGVPPGRYTLRAWHERGGARASALEVPSSGITGVALSLDARGYRPVPHRNKFGQEYAPAGRDRYE